MPLPRSGRADQPICILLVDDDPKNLMVLETILDSAEYRLVKATSADEALLALMHDEFAAIVLDVQMPDMSGIELARLIKQRKKTQRVPVVFLTAHYQEDEHIVLGYGAGAVDYITKPVNPAVLRSKIGVFIDLFRAEAALRGANAELAAKNEELERQAEDRARRVRAEAAKAEAEAARERSALLAETSNVLAASFDRAEIFTALAHTLVPRFADCVSVDVAEESGALRPIVIVHRDTETERAVRAYRAAFPQRLDEPSAITMTLKAGHPLVCTEFGPREIEAFSRTPAEAAALLPLGIRSYLVLPLQARGRTLGGMCLASAAAGRFGDKDLSFAEELAQRAALALDNSRLYDEARVARETAEAANAAKDRFLAMLSHELRTPLSPVLHAVSLLEAEGNCPASARGTLETIRRNVQLEARLIDDLLDLARIRNGKLQLHLETVDAHDLLRRALDICEPEIAARRLRVQLDLAARGTRLQADPARIQQIFWNLLNNAVKYTPPEGTVVVRTMDAGDESVLRIEIADSGIGIEAERIGKVFNAFEQAHGARSTGLGLGLAICRALASLHGGSIEARSEGAGRGTTFAVTLPAVCALPASDATPPVAAPAASLAGLRVLLVEDHADTSATLERLLKLRGYAVWTAADCATAERALGELEFDILISDIGLPDGSGLDLMPQFTEANASRPSAGIALSGFGTLDDIERSRTAGFHEHLTKPVDFSLLQKTLVKMVAQMHIPAAA